jgi:glucokinase
MYVGLDIGGTNARASLYNDESACLATARVSIREDTSPTAIADAIVALISQLNPAAPPRAVGLGLAAQLDRTGELVINSPNLGWRDVPFAQILRERLGGPHVKVVNDLSALLWGEHTAGAARGVQDALAVYVGTGIGGGILSGGQLLEGAGGKAGEIGHLKLFPGGRLCGCGERGCAEAHAGGVHLEQQVAAICAEHHIEGVARDGAPGAIDLARADRISADHPALDVLWRQASGAIATLVGHGATLLNPQVVLLGGGVLMNCPRMSALVLEQIPSFVSRPAAADMSIRFGSLGDTAGMLGAAGLARRALA